MDSFVRKHVPAITATLTAVSLALVFGAALQVGPASSLPRAPDAALAAIPHVNAAVSLAAIVTIVAGVRAIRRGYVGRHRQLMLASVGLFALFLVLYLYRVSLEGPTPFGGPAWMQTYLYYPFLAVHVTLAVVCLPLLYYVLLLAYVTPVRELGATAHPRVGRVAAALWIVSFSMGLGVYVLLYWAF